MRPVLFRLGPLIVHSYPALLSAGVILAAGLVFVRGRRRGIPPLTLADALLATALGALLLGRAAYVAVHWDYYVHHLRSAVQPWDGGLVWHGALVGGLLGTVLLGRLRNVPLLTLLDLLAPGAAALSIFAWLGCLTVGCAWGVPVYPEQRLLWSLSLDVPDLYGIREPRVAVQLLGAAWSLLVLCAVWRFRHRIRHKGALFSLWLTLHSAACFTLGFLRGDDWPLVLGWRVDQLLNLALSIAGVCGLVAAFSDGPTGHTHETSSEQRRSSEPSGLS